MCRRDGAAMAVASQAYADQSHMIRDFYRFVGWTPATFLREHQNIAAATLLGRRMAGRRSPPRFVELMNSRVAPPDVRFVQYDVARSV